MKKVSNFSFLQERFPVLAKLGDFAEQYCFSDPNSSIMKSGMMNETLVNLIFTFDRLPLPVENTAVNRINTLFREGMITRDISDIMHAFGKPGMKLPMRIMTTVKKQRSFWKWRIA